MPWNYIHSRVKLTFQVNIYDFETEELLTIENKFNEQWKSGVRDFFSDTENWKSIIPELESILQPTVTFSENGYNVKVLLDGEHPDFMDYDEYIYHIFPTWNVFTDVNNYEDFSYTTDLVEHNAVTVADDYQMGGRRRNRKYRSRRIKNKQGRKTRKNKCKK